MIYLKSLAISLGVILGFAIIIGGGALLGLGAMYLLLQLLISYAPYLPHIPHIPNEAGPYIVYIIIGVMFIWMIISGAYCVRRDGMDINGNLIPFKHWGYWGDGKWKGREWRNGVWK